MRRISLAESERIEALSRRLGDRTLRQLLTKPGSRLVRPERLDRLSRGSGRLSDQEASLLQNVSRNSNALSALKTKGVKKNGGGAKEFRTNRALRDWLLNGKTKGFDTDRQSESEQDSKQKAIKALRYLGVDPSDGTFYLKG